MAGDYTFMFPVIVTFTTDASQAPVPMSVPNLDAVHTGDRTFQLQLLNPIGGPIVDGKDILDFTVIDNGMACCRPCMVTFPLEPIVDLFATLYFQPTHPLFGLVFAC